MSDDPKLSERYRELPREEPPRALDDAILAASRRAIESRPAPLVAPTGRRRWYVPVAAAAVIVLAVAVVAHIDREQPDTEVVTPSARVLETPPPPPARAPVESRRDQAPQVAQKPAREQFTPDSQADSGRRAEPARAPAAAPAPAAPASMAEERKAIEELRSREAENQTARARAQGATSPPVATTASALARVAPSPEQWLQGIADLRRQGRHEEADRALAEFRKHYPDYRLSDEMKAKVERR